MELILISVILLLVFGFVSLITVGYAITLWEQKKLEDMSKNLHSKKVDYTTHPKHNYSTTENNYSSDMKVSQKVNHYIEKSLVLVKNQDYEGWLNKTTTVVKKVSSNLELYTKFAWSKFMQLITKEKSSNSSLSDQNTQSTTKEVDDTIDKINSINQKQDNVLEVESINEPINSTFHSNNSRAKPVKSSATLNIASDSQQEDIDAKKAKDEIYEKIESSILQRLKETGLSHYDIWLELGKHYEKYGEHEKAIEIYSMIMKNSQGRERDMARNGLIALS